MLIFAFFARTEAFLQELRKEQRQNNKKWQYTGTPTPTKYFKRCIAMNETAINWDSVPEIITKNQLYKICHISKSTALYLLRSGKIPCEYNGKKTRCYKIKKKDVIKYLENRKVFPECYSAPAGWYRGNYSIKLETKIPESALKNLRQYYTEMLAQYPDVMTATEVSKIIGYGKTTVNNWCNKGYIKSFKRNNTNHIPKVYLIEFLCSKYFRTITRKSKWHIGTLQQFPVWLTVNGLDNKK